MSPWWKRSCSSQDLAGVLDVSGALYPSSKLSKLRSTSILIVSATVLS